jgi:hypothetical protein
MMGNLMNRKSFFLFQQTLFALLLIVDYFFRGAVGPFGAWIGMIGTSTGIIWGAIEREKV